jgi:lysophospholipase L1-like esterase
MLRPHDRILFQGDSITDAGRAKTDGFATSGRHLGSGYAMMAAAILRADDPAAGYDIRNLGISGNRVVDLYARIKEHGWNLAPEVLSILIGVNDTWHGFKRQAGVEVDRFARVYRMLLTETRARLPEVRLVLGEPFSVPCGEVVPGWMEDLRERIAVVHDLVREFGAVLVPYQRVFDEACDRAPPAHWAADGVHPTEAGHLLMARAWLAAVLPGG